MLEKRLVFLVIFISSSRIGKTWCQSPTSHVLNGHKEASYCPTSSNSELFKAEDVLEWLNQLEFEKQAEILPLTKISKDEKSIKCRANCLEESCCTVSKSYNHLNITNLDENNYRFNYDNDTFILNSKVDKNGLWHGIMLGFEKWFLTMNMTLIANFEHGFLNGEVWRPLEENGFLVSDNLEMDGQNVLYIYPGFKLGLYGHFDHGKMISAREVKILGYICRNEIMVPKWTYLDQENSQNKIHSYDPATMEQFSLHPLLKDPLEDYYLDVFPSTIPGAGQGVFLKRDAPQNTVVGFFNGISITLDDTLRNQDMKESVHKMWNDWTDDELIYVPKEYVDINVYNATFGHKINHNSDFNVDAGYLNHPRFGRIRSIVTTQDLKAGQEIFCQYAGTVDSSTFVRQIFKDFSNFMDLEDDSSRLNYLSDMKEDYSSMLASLNHEPDRIYRKPSIV